MHLCIFSFNFLFVRGSHIGGIDFNLFFFLVLALSASGVILCCVFFNFNIYFFHFLISVQAKAYVEQLLQWVSEGSGVVNAEARVQ